MPASPTSPKSPTGRFNSTGGSFRSIDSPFNGAPRIGAQSKWSSSMGKTIGAKLGAPGRMCTPGPGSYSPTDWSLPRSPQYSLSPRRGYSGQMTSVPGY